MRFKKVYIEITNVCNLNCNFCPKTKRKLCYMHKDAFISVLKSIKPYTEYIYFHLMGEPLLHPDLKEFLEISEKEGFKVNLTTNGTLIQEKKEDLLKARALRQINFSLHSFEANERVGVFDQYLDDIIDFIKEANEKTSMICSLRLWNLTQEKVDTHNELNRYILNRLDEAFGLMNTLEKIMEGKMQTKLRDRVYLNMAEKFEWATLTKGRREANKFCLGLRDQIGILSDGTVVPCCLDNDGNIPLGNIYEETLEDILNSERAQKLYEGFSRRLAVEELCKRCGYR